MPASNSHDAVSCSDTLHACDSTSAHHVLCHIEEMVRSFTPPAEKVQPFCEWLFNTYQCDMQGLSRHVAASVDNAMRVMLSTFRDTIESDCKKLDNPEEHKKMWTTLVNTSKSANETEGNIAQCFTPRLYGKGASSYRTIADVCQKRDRVYAGRQSEFAGNILLHSKRQDAVLQLQGPCEIAEVTVKLIDMVLLVMLKLYYMQKYFEQQTCRKCEDILRVFILQNAVSDQNLQLDLIIFACFKLYLVLESTELSSWVTDYECKMNNHHCSITTLLRRPKYPQMPGLIVKKFEIPQTILVQGIFGWNGREFWLLPHQKIGPGFEILPRLSSKKDFFVGAAGMMNKCITGKNVYDTINALLLIFKYNKIDKPILFGGSSPYLQKLPDIMAVYSLRFSASAIAVTVVMSILNDQYCRLQYQMRQSDMNCEGDCEKMSNYFDALMNFRKTYYNSLERPGAALIPCKRKSTPSCNDLDLTVETIKKIVNGTISTPEDKGI